jgi:hypothetical protein
MVTATTLDHTEYLPPATQGVNRAGWPKDNETTPTEAGSFRLTYTSTQNAQRNYERYLILARAEAQAGNPVAAENYYQHAEHYFRLMSSTQEKD